MRSKSWVLAISLAAFAAGAASTAYSNPLDRARSMREARPAAPKPATAAASGPIADQGVHNAVHAAHQNQIVFTRSDLGIGAISEKDIVTDFTLGQPMFFRVFTERSAVNAIAAANNMPAGQVYADGVHYTARFTIDGQAFDTGIFPWGNRRTAEPLSQLKIVAIHA